MPKLSTEQIKARLDSIHGYVTEHGSASYKSIAAYLLITPSTSSVWCGMAARYFPDLVYEKGILRVKEVVSQP